MCQKALNCLIQTLENSLMIEFGMRPLMNQKFYFVLDGVNVNPRIA